MNSFWRKIFIYWAPVLFWSLLIFLLSAVPGSGEAHYDFVTFLERKTAHVLEYLILTILWIRVFGAYFGKNKIVYCWPILLAFVWAVSDEIHQLFVSGRQGKITDVLIDLLGILLAVWFYQKLEKWRAGIKK